MEEQKTREIERRMDESIPRSAPTQKQSARALGCSQQHISNIRRGLVKYHWARQAGVGIYKLARHSRADADAVIVELMSLIEEAYAETLTTEQLEREVLIGIEREAAAEPIEDREVRHYLRTGEVGQCPEAQMLEARELVKLAARMRVLKARRRVH